MVTPQTVHSKLLIWRAGAIASRRLYTAPHLQDR
jgi:hypothetical protein